MLLAQAASVASRYAFGDDGVVAARPQAPAARLIAASRSGLGVRRSALSGVRSSACCTPALLPRSIGVERLQRLLMVLSSRRPIAQFRWKKRPRMKSKCSYACLPIRWHGSPCGPAVREVVHQFSVEGPRVRGPIARFRS